VAEVVDTSLLKPIAEIVGDSREDSRLLRGVEAVEEGKPLEDCIPVEAAPTAENADLLRRRLDFLRKNVLA
jgi:hypothetical protein